MIYALRRNRETDRRTLVELSGKNKLNTVGGAEPGFSYSAVTPRFAHDRVRRGHEHETGLFVDDGRIRYAPPQRMP